MVGKAYRLMVTDRASADLGGGKDHAICDVVLLQPLIPVTLQTVWAGQDLARGTNCRRKPDNVESYEQQRCAAAARCLPRSGVLGHRIFDAPKYSGLQGT